jgi:hypothetical protein
LLQRIFSGQSVSPNTQKASNSFELLAFLALLLTNCLLSAAVLLWEAALKLAKTFTESLLGSLR